MAVAMLRLALCLSTWVLLSAAVGFAADPPPESLKVPPRPADLKFPAGSVIVVRGSANAPTGQSDAIVLTPDEYRRLLEQIEQLKKSQTPEKPEPPSKCTLSGRVETRGQQEIVKIQATFEFVSSATRRAFFLGFRRAAAVGAQLDGSALPPLQANADGSFGVTVDSPGTHKLVLDLELPLQYRGGKSGERGFVLNLPGSPITVIDQIELPAGVSSARLRPILSSASPLINPPRTWKAQDLRKPKADWPAMALGAIEGLELFWDGPTIAKPSDPLITVDGDIRVQISETSIQSTATLTLKSLRGAIAEWKLTTPSGAEVNLAGASLDAGLSATPMNDDKSQWIVRGREGGAESLTLEVVAHASRKEGGVPIGPFAVQGALREQGTIRVTAPNNLRPRFKQKRSDVTQRELPPDVAPPAEAKAEFLQAAFTYGQGVANAPASTLLHVNVETIRGEVRTAVSHSLTLNESGWRLVTEIKATPIRTELETIEVDIPTALQANLQASPPELVEKIERPDPALNRYLIRLAHPRRTETVIRLESVWPKGQKVPGSFEAGGSESLAILLPRVLGTFDRDGRVTVGIPEGMEVRGAVREWERDRPGEWARPLEEQSGKPPTLSQATVRTPGAVDLTWRPLSALIPVHSTIDLTIEDRQIWIVHRISLPKSPNARQVILRAGEVQPPGQVQVVEGGSLAANGMHEWTLTVPASPDRDPVAVLRYPATPATQRPDIGQRIDIGLLWPVTEATCESRLWVWMRTTGLALRPVLADGPWEDLPPEPAPEHASLPALVLHGSGAQLPLALRFEQAAGLTPAGLIIERVLIQVHAEGGQHRYIARFLLLPVAAPVVDLELPAAIAALNDLTITLGDRRVEHPAVVDETGSPVKESVGRIVRIPLPAKRAAMELRVEYFQPSWRPVGWAGSWRLGFVPPKLRGAALAGSVRWHISLPGNEFVLPGDDRTVLDQRWGLRRFMPAPVPSRNAEDLENWFRAGLDEAPGEGPTEYSLAGTEAVVRQTGLEPIQIVPVARMPWFLVCSLAVLLVGGTLFMLRGNRYLLWLLAIATLVGCSAAAIFWPQISVAVLAGSPPGWLVLGLMIGFLTWQSRRYRRRVVFMPGFSREKIAPAPNRPSGSGSAARQRQPSTVDAPPSV